MNVGSKRLIAGGVVAGGAMVVMAGMVIGAGLARADDNGPFSGPMGDHSAAAYWTDITPEVNGDVNDAAALAHVICNALDSGQSEGEVIAHAAQGKQSQVDPVTFVVHAAEWHFCPDHY